MVKVNLFRDGERSRGNCAIGALQTQHHEGARERTGNMRRAPKRGAIAIEICHATRTRGQAVLLQL
jgi:hypothetical protein